MRYTPYNNLHLMFLHTVGPNPHVHPLHPAPPKKAGARTLLHLTVCGTNHSRDFGSMLCFGFLKSAPWPKTGSEPSLSKLNPLICSYLYMRVSCHNCYAFTVVNRMILQIANISQFFMEKPHSKLAHRTLRKLV